MLPLTTMYDDVTALDSGEMHVGSTELTMTSPGRTGNEGLAAFQPEEAALWNRMGQQLAVEERVGHLVVGGVEDVDCWSS